MPKGSKKRRAKRKQETANDHPPSTNSSAPQGNGAGGDHESSDYQLTDEDFSPRAGMETPPEPEPKPNPEPHPNPEPQPEPVPDPNTDPEPEPAVREAALVLPIEQQNVSKSEQTEAATAVASEVLEEPSASFLVGKKSVEGSLHHEQTEVPDTISRDVAAARSVPLLERRASWWNCCGLIDVFNRST